MEIVLETVGCGWLDLDILTSSGREEAFKTYTEESLDEWATRFYQKTKGVERCGQSEIEANGSFACMSHTVKL